MLGALSLKWKWRQRREAAGKATDRPNLVFGGDVHVVWEKFCRYFDVEPRIIPLQPDRYTIGPEDVEPHVDENTIGVAAVLGTTFTGHADDIKGINDLLIRIRDERGLDVPMHVDGASGGFVWPFLYPDSEWDFRLEQVRSINASGHKFGLVYPGMGWLIFREPSDLAEDLVFYENYLGKTDATFTLNFSTGSAMVLAQYYQFVRLGHEGYRFVMETMQANAKVLATRIAELGPFRLIGDESDGAAAARRVPARRGARLRRVRRRVAARRRARLDGPRVHAAAERGARHDHARAREADARPLPGEDARRGPRAGLRDARQEGRAARARPQARQDRHRLLKEAAMSTESAQRILVVANRTASTPAMLGEVQRRAKEGARFGLLIPPVHPDDPIDWSAEDARALLERAGAGTVEEVDGGEDAALRVHELVHAREYDARDRLDGRTTTWSAGATTTSRAASRTSRCPSRVIPPEPGSWGPIEGFPDDWVPAAANPAGMAGFGNY